MANRCCGEESCIHIETLFSECANQRDLHDAYVPDRKMADASAASIAKEIAKVLTQAASSFPPRRRSSSDSSPPSSKPHSSLRADEALEEDYEAIVQAWLDEHREQMEDALEAIILISLLAEVTRALRAWLNKLGYSQCSRPRPSRDMEEWLSERIGSDASYIGDVIQKRIREIVKDAQASGLSHEETLRRIRSFLGNASAIEELVKGIGTQTAYDATNFGAFLVNAVVGTTTKFWYTRSGSPCPICKQNELQGPVPIDFPFQSGHMYPPAHILCPCFAAYSNLERDNIEAALNMFSVVCQYGPS